jgi:hypothetical protein
MRRRINDIEALLPVSARHPIQVVCLLGVLALVTVGRPWSCITHCEIIDGDHQHHGHTIRTGFRHTDDDRQYSFAGLLDGYDPCDDRCEESPQPMHEEPSPLTIAVMLLLLLLSHIRHARIRLIEQTLDVLSYAPSPPIRPPASSIPVANAGLLVLDLHTA